MTPDEQRDAIVRYAMRPVEAGPYMAVRSKLVAMLTAYGERQYTAGFHDGSSDGWQRAMEQSMAMSENGVFTRTVCDSCGKSDERPGAEGSTPPVGWSAVKLTRREGGSGWTNHTPLVDGFFCPECAARIAAAASPTGRLR